MIPLEQKVLIVEDEQESEVLIEKAFRAINRDIRLRWVKSAEEAEKILQENPDFDFIIADHFLKGSETGLDLWRHCREKRETVPFILTSALEEEFFGRLMKGEYQRPLFLRKPFGISDCKNMIEWFWEDLVSFEPESYPDHPQIRIHKSSRYKILWLTILSVLSTLLLFSTKLDFYSFSNELSPFAPTTPLPIGNGKIVFEKSNNIKTHSHTIKTDKVLTPDLKMKLVKIMMRADEVLDSLSENPLAKRSLLPQQRVHRPFRNDFYEKCESYGHLVRRA